MIPLVAVIVRQASLPALEQALGDAIAAGQDAYASRLADEILNRKGYGALVGPTACPAAAPSTRVRRDHVAPDVAGDDDAVGAP